MFLKVCFSGVMGWVEVLAMREVRFGRRCWVSVGGVEEDGVVVARFGDVYVVGVALDDWFGARSRVEKVLGEATQRQ
jgi:hypothetical protein